MAISFPQGPPVDPSKEVNYPWAEWLSYPYKRFIIAQGVEYRIHSLDMSRAIHKKAYHRGIKVTTHVDHVAETVTFQFYRSEDTKPDLNS